MKLRKWSPKQKAQIVLEGLKGRPVQEICTEYQIAQSQYYQWRDQFLSRIDKPFIDDNQEFEHLVRKNARLERMVGELTMELKKSEEVLW